MDALEHVPPTEQSPLLQHGNRNVPYENAPPDTRTSSPTCNAEQDDVTPLPKLRMFVYAGMN